MQKDYMENWASMSRDAVRPSMNYYNLATKVIETITRNNLDLLNHCVANCVKQFQTIGTGKFENVITAVTDNNNKVVGCVQQNLEVLRQATNDFNRLFEETLQYSVKDVMKKPVVPPVGSKVEA